MYGMFTSAFISNGSLYQYESSFNGNLSSWDISRVTTFDKMFYYASSFDQKFCLNDQTIASFDDIFTGSHGSFCT